MSSLMHRTADAPLRPGAPPSVNGPAPNFGSLCGPRAHLLSMLHVYYFYPFCLHISLCLSTILDYTIDSSASPPIGRVTLQVHDPYPQCACDIYPQWQMRWSLHPHVPLSILLCLTLYLSWTTCLTYLQLWLNCSDLVAIPYSKLHNDRPFLNGLVYAIIWSNHHSLMCRTMDHGSWNQDLRLRLGSFDNTLFVVISAGCHSRRPHPPEYTVN